MSSTSTAETVELPPPLKRGEVEVHICSPWASSEDCHRQWPSIYQPRVCRVPGRKRGGPCMGGALSLTLQRAGGKGSADLQGWP